MIYRVFELIGIHRIEPIGYDHKAIINYTLEHDDFPEEFKSFEDAENWIKDNSKDLIYTQLTIIPIYNINRDGEIN